MFLLLEMMKWIENRIQASQRELHGQFNETNTIYEVLCAIWYYLHKSKNVKTHMDKYYFE